MDAKDRLRRYLEQRRELGESELVLDGLPVDDVMSLLGARSTSPRASGAPAPVRPSSREQQVREPAVREPAEQDERAPVQGDERAHDPSMERAPQDDVPQVSPPREPEHRFDPNASTDWRETLRRAGAAKPSAGLPNRVPGTPPLSETREPGGIEAPTHSRASTPAPVPSPSPSGDEQPTLLPAAALEGVDTMPAWLRALDVPFGLTAGQAATRALEPAIAALPTLDALAEMVRVCTRCDLYRTAINPVPGSGDPNADFVCVGEAPGQNEDEQGVPFVGAAGDLLNKILRAIDLTREQVFVCNVLKHRPPGNRDPLPEEVRACEPYLRRQLELLKPRVILALGRFAAQSLLQTTTPIGKLRGQIHRYHGIPLIVTYHPAALLRNEAWKRPTWDDVRLARRILDASRASLAE